MESKLVLTPVLLSESDSRCQHLFIEIFVTLQKLFYIMFIYLEMFWGLRFSFWKTRGVCNNPSIERAVKHYSGSYGGKVCHTKSMFCKLSILCAPSFRLQTKKHFILSYYGFFPNPSLTNVNFFIGCLWPREKLPSNQTCHSWAAHISQRTKI